MPESWSEWSTIVSFDVSNNRLSGRLPPLRLQAEQVVGAAAVKSSAQAEEVQSNFDLDVDQPIPFWDFSNNR